MNEEVKNEIINLRKNSKVAYVSSVDENGCPAVKAMLVLENESLQTHYFSTNFHSHEKVLENPKPCVHQHNGIKRTYVSGQ
jgi:general stress protein 26